jgi:hypothetical protein
VAGATVLVVALVTIATVGTGAIGRSASPAAPRFVDEAGTAGLDHAYEGDFPYFVGGGVATFDCDGDGFPDVYLAGGASPAALFRNRSAVGGALKFERLASPVTDLDAVTGAYPIDVDSDGLTDLAVLRVGETEILRGTGDCAFEPANDSLGFEDGDAWTVAFAATWEDGNALPTLALGHYVTLDPAGEATFTCPPNSLVRPAQSGSGYAAPAELAPGWCPLSMLFSDWSRSGRIDLRISNDRHYYADVAGAQEQLWEIAGGAPRLYSESDGWMPLRIWGMGIASQDVTGDGLPEVYLTSQADNKLQTLADGPDRPTYRDIALARGAIATWPYGGPDALLPSTAWHAEFDDVNNDGLMDLFVAKGNIEAQPDYAIKDPSNLLIGQADGSFVEGAEQAGIMTFRRGRGASLADFNRDGLLDLLQVNRLENVSLWRNVGAGSGEAPAPLGNWLGIRLEQPPPNNDAIGSWIELRAGDRTTPREVTVGGGHASGQLGWTHFGLGGADGAEVRVTWPDGEVGPWIPVRGNEYATIQRGSTEPTYLTVPDR